LGNEILDSHESMGVNAANRTSGTASDRPVKTRTCGCRARPRRRCELCDPGRLVFTACGSRCLQSHLSSQHRDRAGGAAERAQERQAAINRARQGWDVYQSHRARLTGLLRAVQRGEGLCVLGAGNCDDLDLPVLCREFGEVHLVDLDGAALELALARLPYSVRGRVVTHAGLEISGTIERLDRWGDEYPGDGELAAMAGEISSALAARLGRSFDVVLSACLLSQLRLPVQETLLLGLEEWQRLFGAIDRAHLATVAALTRSGGSGVLALDLTSSLKLPELAAFVSPASWDGLAAAANQAISARRIDLSVDPASLLGWLTQAEFARSVERARLSEPWVWDTGGGVLALVQALLFIRS
jgi:hypothetical protein